MSRPLVYSIITLHIGVSRLSAPVLPARNDCISQCLVDVLWFAHLSPTARRASGGLVEACSYYLMKCFVLVRITINNSAAVYRQQSKRKCEQPYEQPAALSGSGGVEYHARTDRNT